VLTNAKIDYEEAYYKEQYGLDLFEQVPSVLQMLIDWFNQKKSVSDATDGLKFLSS
jgi:hypothetical protein